MNVKRQALLDMGKMLFLKHGVKRVSVEEICRESSVSKVTFYKYFKNKNELLLTIRENLMDEGFSKFDEINKEDITFLEKVNRMSLWRKEFFNKLEGEFLYEIIELDVVSKKYMDRYKENILIAQGKGEICQEISPELVILITEKLFEITKEGKWKESFDDYKTYQDQLRSIIFFGLLTRNEDN